MFTMDRTSMTGNDIEVTLVDIGFNGLMVSCRAKIVRKQDSPADVLPPITLKLYMA